MSLSPVKVKHKLLYKSLLLLCLSISCGEIKTGIEISIFIFLHIDKFNLVKLFKEKG